MAYIYHETMQIQIKTLLFFPVLASSILLQCGVCCLLRASIVPLITPVSAADLSSVAYRVKAGGRMAYNNVDTYGIWCFMVLRRTLGQNGVFRDNCLSSPLTQDDICCDLCVFTWP